MENIMTMKVVGASMPLELVRDLDIVAKHLSVTRSAVITALLSERIPLYATMCERVAPLERANSRRFVGSSQGDIIRLLGALSVGLEVTQGELFSE